MSVHIGSREWPTPPGTLQDLERIAESVGPDALKGFQPFGEKRVLKPDGTPVTDDDKNVNRKFIHGVRQFDKTSDIVGEEMSSRRWGQRWQWWTDPIDGTYPKTHGVPTFCHMSCLTYDKYPIFGVVYDPYQKHLFSAERGKGAWFNRTTELKVSDGNYSGGKPWVALCTWPGAKFKLYRAAEYLDRQGVCFHNYGSVGYHGMMVAKREFAGSIFPGNPKYHGHIDTSPSQVIIEEAGGVATDIFGEPLDFRKKFRGHIMADRHLHPILVEAVRISMRS